MQIGVDPPAAPARSDGGHPQRGTPAPRDPAAGPLHRGLADQEAGGGRASAGPSTYAAVISTIQNREYVVKKSGSLLPSYIGIAVIHLLRNHFAHYVDIPFTARMEQDLDRIAGGDVDWIEFLDGFWKGNGRPAAAWSGTSPSRAGRHRVPAHPPGHLIRRRASPSSCASAAPITTSRWPAIRTTSAPRFRWTC